LQPVPDTSLILVCVTPGQRDLDIARLLGWYRIPLKSAPKVIDVDYLAFYQTNAFGEEHRWKIESICPVRGHELVTRADLFHDEADQKRAREEYFKISLGPMQSLVEPISAGNWKRITFLYTIGELFNQAATINQLVVRSESRQLLWQTLRDRLTRGSESDSTEPEINDIDDPLLLEALLKWIEFPTGKNKNIYGT
jgi:hypothetical protein